MSEPNLAEITTEPKSVEGIGRIGAVDIDFSKDFSRRRGCLACGIPLQTGCFCSQNCRTTYGEWTRQVIDYVGPQNIDPVRRFIAKWGTNYAPAAVA